MSDTLEQVERTQSLAIQTSVLKAVAQIPAMTPRTGGMPKVVITGDIRLRVTESSAALRPMKGHYRIETERMQEPLHVIWMIEGNVLNHTVHAIDVAFDVRGPPAGETLTRVLTAQVQRTWPLLAYVRAGGQVLFSLDNMALRCYSI